MSLLASLGIMPAGPNSGGLKENSGRSVLPLLRRMRCPLPSEGATSLVCSACWVGWVLLYLQSRSSGFSRSDGFHPCGTPAETGQQPSRPNSACPSRRPLSVSRYPSNVLRRLQARASLAINLPNRMTPKPARNGTSRHSRNYLKHRSFRNHLQINLEQKARQQKHHLTRPATR